jgi:RNA polymerase sigma factor for flagellar operon FliA
MQTIPSSTTNVRHALIQEYAPMVRRVAYRMARHFPRSVDADDLYQIGMLGLMDAVERYEDSRAVSFTAYVRMRVKGAILDEMRKQDWVPRSVRDRAARLDRSRKELTEQLGRKPSNRELATFMGVTEERLEELVRTADVRVLVSTEEGGDDETSIGETLAAEVQPEAEIEERSQARIVQAAVGELSERDRLILDLYYYRDLNFKEIAQVLGVTESRVSQLHSRIRKKLQEKLADQVA